MTSIRSFSLLQGCGRGCLVALPVLALLSAGPALADENVGTSAVPDCFGPEPITWFNPDSSATPSKIVIQDACGMPSEFFVLMHDASGHVADSPGDHEVTDDGLLWLRVEPWSDGEYIEHVWIHTESATSARVWIAYEPLDGAGNFVTDETFSNHAPRVFLERDAQEFLFLTP